MRTRVAYGVAALLVIAGAALGPFWSLPATLPAAATGAILLVFLIAGRPLRRRLPVAVAVAGGLSLLATFWIYYRLDIDERLSVMVSIAVLFELAAVIWLMILLVRHSDAPGIWLGCTFAIPAQLAVFFRGFQETSTAIGSVGGLAFWSVGSIAAVLGGFYLRSLDDSRTQAIRNARQAQRMDLARDLHDYVAHDISGIVVQAQAAQVVAEQNPEAVLDSLRRIEEAGQQALSTMDRTVRMLRDPDAPEPTLGLSELPTLVRRFDESGPVCATLSSEPGLVDRLPPEVSATLYRVAVEGLTNVRRHAPDSRSVTVEVHTTGADRDEVELTIRNGGSTGATAGGPARSGGAERSAGPARIAGPARSGGGLGLDGLTERVETLGGQLSAGPDDEGWILVVRLPLPPA